MSWVFGIITFIYALFTLFLLFGFRKVEEQTSEPTEAGISFSIIVPFRNEAAVLPALLASFAKILYPRQLFEVILVNDSSEDDSEVICRAFMEAHPEIKLVVLQSENKTGSPKKDALLTGIEVAVHPYILTTDADCVVPENWLKAYNRELQEKAADLVAGPVRIEGGKGFLARFQEIDFFSLQAASIGAFGVDQPFMCNGANLIYKKDRFFEVGGFQGNEGIASGDDVFLLEKFRRQGFKTVFLKDASATVTTLPQGSLKTLFMQRMRWAAKASSYQSFFPRALGLAVLLMNFLLLLGVILLIAGLDVKQALGLAFLVKFNVDFLLIYKAAQFLKQERRMKNYFWASMIYPIFCCGPVILSLVASYKWKGRNFRK